MSNEAGRAVRLVGAVNDLSERNATEKALRDSEERHKLAMKAINEGVYEWDVATGEMYYSPRVRDLVGGAWREPLFMPHTMPDVANSTCKVGAGANSRFPICPTSIGIGVTSVRRSSGEIAPAQAAAG